MQASDITKDVLFEMYTNQRISPDEIAEKYKCSGRTVRNKMQEFGIQRLGASHLRKGKSAIWNIGITRSAETIEKCRQANIGKTPHNYGKGRIYFFCEVCGTSVFDKPYRKKRTCSNKCRDALASINRGKLHWNYKSEMSNANQRSRLWAECIEWRENVLNRDKSTCQKCKKKGGKLTAHHIDSWATHPDVRFNVNNGVTLCYQCHRSFHSEYGQKHNTRFMFDEWITK